MGFYDFTLVDGKGNDVALAFSFHQRPSLVEFDLYHFIISLPALLVS